MVAILIDATGKDGLLCTMSGLTIWLILKHEEDMTLTGSVRKLHEWSPLFEARSSKGRKLQRHQQYRVVWNRAMHRSLCPWALANRVLGLSALHTALMNKANKCHILSHIPRTYNSWRDRGHVIYTNITKVVDFKVCILHLTHSYKFYYILCKRETTIHIQILMYMA